MGNFPLLGLDKHAWEDHNKADLITTRRRDSDDLMSRWVSESIIPWFHSKIGKRFKKPVPYDRDCGISHYSDSRIRIVVDIIGTVISSLFPISSIAILYFASSMVAKLGIIAGFTAFFSLCLALVTQARRIEIFAATAA